MLHPNATPDGLSSLRQYVRGGGIATAYTRHAAATTFKPFVLSFSPYFTYFVQSVIIDYIINTAIGAISSLYQFNITLSLLFV